MSSAEPSTPSKGLTEKQVQLMGAILQNCGGKLDINWDDVATQAGYKSAASARETYRVMAKKLGWNTGAATNYVAGGTAPTSAGSKSKTGPAGAPPGPSSAGPTPTKVQKNTGKVGSAKRGRPRKDSVAARLLQEALPEEEKQQLGAKGKKAKGKAAAAGDGSVMQGGSAVEDDEGDAFFTSAALACQEQKEEDRRDGDDDDYDPGV